MRQRAANGRQPGQRSRTLDGCGQRGGKSVASGPVAQPGQALGGSALALAPLLPHTDGVMPWLAAAVAEPPADDASPS